MRIRALRVSRRRVTRHGVSRPARRAHSIRPRRCVPRHMRGNVLQMDVRRHIVWERPLVGKGCGIRALGRGLDCTRDFRLVTGLAGD